MPGVYKRKGGKNQWTDDQLKKAMKKVRDKEMSLRLLQILTAYHQ